MTEHKENFQDSLNYINGLETFYETGKKKEHIVEIQPSQNCISNILQINQEKYKHLPYFNIKRYKGKLMSQTCIMDNVVGCCCGCGVKKIYKNSSNSFLYKQNFLRQKILT